MEVELTNRLSEPTLIHWHGLRLPAPMDGTALTQRSVMPGETFTYRFKLLDAGTSGTTRTPTRRCRWSGVYGALIVRGEGEPKLDREPCWSSTT